MSNFINYLNNIEALIKSKRYDEAWRFANEGLIKIKGEDRFMMYYQMAIITAKEKKWQNALEKMAFVIYYLGGLGGTSHRKFVIRLLKKLKKENLFENYIKLAQNNPPRSFSVKLSKLLNN